jgi:hypothetical protein
MLAAAAREKVAVKTLLGGRDEGGRDVTSLKVYM